jgi:hypothetical protein
MPPVYKRRYRNYCQKSLNLAMKEVENKTFSIRHVSRRSGVPQSTLLNKMKGRHGGKQGGQMMFNKTEENLFLSYIVQVAEWGFPMNLIDVRMMVKNYLDSNGKVIKKFKNNYPGMYGSYLF